MSARVFLDTNVLIYLYSITELEKKGKAEILLNNYSSVVISTQTINELVNVLWKKKKLSPELIDQVVDELLKTFVLVTVLPQTIKLSLKIMERYHFSYFDSLMVASAFENQCSILFTEDMHHQQVILNELTIINPFK